MTTRRMARLNEQLRADVAELIAREMKDPRLAGLVSVTAAEMSPDLRHARVFISVLGSDEDRKKTLQAIRSAAGFLRTQLASRMTTKRAPELHFTMDASIERGQRIMNLLHEIESSQTSSTDAREGDADAAE